LPAGALALVLAAGLVAQPARGQGKVDCGEAYKKAWESIKSEDYARLTPEQLVTLTRKALRIYDACQTGDVHDVRALFKRLEGPPK
jgi:hypothetical protein